MKPYQNPRRAERASSYLTVLWSCLIVSFLVFSYLAIVGIQNAASMRSQAWNRCIAVSEAGIEEALAHLQKNGLTNNNLASDGWWILDGHYYKRRKIDDGVYEVAITPNTTSPTILSRGYVKQVQNFWDNDSDEVIADLFYWGTWNPQYLGRTVRVETRRDGMFMKGMVAKHWIDLNGNNIVTDSFDSADPRYSTNGLYYAPWSKDNGDVATTSGLTNGVNLDIGNANIHGRLATGPRGTISIGPNGSVGSHAWVNGGNKGLQPGYFTDDMNVSFAPVGAPFSTGYFTPSAGTVGGTNYDLVLGTGSYLSSTVGLSSEQKVLVNGHAVWWCKGNFSLSGKAAVIIAPGASLKLYVGQTTGSGVSADLSGNGVVNATGYSTNFIYYGLPSNTSLKFAGNAAFVGAVYAPNAAFNLGGGGNNTYDFVGASVTGTVTMNGHFNFHYDEALGRFGPSRGFIIASWNEI